MSVSAKQWNVQEAVAAQTRYCDEHKLPLFIPHDGFCPHCYTNIFSHITVEEAGRKLISGCPRCHYTFVD